MQGRHYGTPAKDKQMNLYLQILERPLLFPLNEPLVIEAQILPPLKQQQEKGERLQAY